MKRRIVYNAVSILTSISEVLTSSRQLSVFEDDRCLTVGLKSLLNIF